MKTDDIFQLSGLAPRGPAQAGDIQAAEQKLGVRFPDDYRAFLQASDGLEGFVGEDAYLMLWYAKEVAELNEGYSVAEFAPGLVLIGTDGGDTGYGFTQKGGGHQYVQVPLVGMSADAIEPKGRSLSDLVRGLRAGGSPTG